MILLLTLSILMAAFAPVFTRRYNNAGLDDVWTFVTANDNFDAYYNVIGKKYTAQAYIGLTPKDKYDVQTAFSSDGTDTPAYSKLIIGASDRLKVNGATKLQNQMQFRYGDSAAGDVVGSLFAGSGNMLLGGKYNKIDSSALENSAFGIGALAVDINNGLSSGVGNTAVGYNSLGKLTGAKYNSAIGYNAGYNASGTGSTYIGYMNNNGSGGSGSYNAMVGAFTGKPLGSYNTAVGNYSMQGSISGNSNIAIGNYAMNKFSNGNGNTAVGYNALAELSSGRFNTAFGANSCNANTGGSYITCIGYNSGSTGSPGKGDGKNPYSKIFDGSDPKDEVVLIGALPEKSIDYKAAAVLEVHNRPSVNSTSAPINNVGNESVVINGNLVVRGQSYFETVLYRPVNSLKRITGRDQDDNKGKPKGLVLMREISDNGMQVFAPVDGSKRKGSSSDERCGCRCRSHAFNDYRENCICTAVSNSSCAPGNTSMPYSSSGYTVSKSYDWDSKTGHSNSYQRGCSDGDSATSYTDKSFNCSITLSRTGFAGNGDIPETDVPFAHLKNQQSCCPNIKTSDIRLKNVGEQFTAGLDEIKKLKVYNYTFKNDPNKLPHVGVIAQDLKMVFPNAVSKDDNGYYKIRWDEMFYAAINAVKTLNTKVQKLASRVAADKERVAVLKRDNDALNAQLDKLADEVTKLEAKKH